MSVEMTYAVIGMPYELAMGDELSKRQFYACAQSLHAEVVRLRARERACPTMQEAEARALVRSLQECGTELGLDNPSPAEIVTAIRTLRGPAH